MNHNKYESPLSSRYASQEMQYIFSPDKKFSTWHRLWIALARAEMELGLPVTQAQVSQLEEHVDDIDYEAAVGGAAVARAHMEAVKRRLKEEKNAKDEDVLVSLQLVNEMLSRGYEFLPIELGKSRGSKYVVEDDKVRLPFSALKGLGGAAAEALERVTIHGEEYISVEELQQASGVGSSILDRLRQVGALGDLPESSQVSFF